MEYHRRYFNSRSPCGERRKRIEYVYDIFEFQLTLPVWGATTNAHARRLVSLISTHAPRVGSDIIRLPIVAKI